MSHKEKRPCLSWVFGFILACFLYEIQARKEILTLPVFYMKIYYTPGDTNSDSMNSKLLTVIPEEVRNFVYQPKSKTKWAIEETYNKTLEDLADFVAPNVAKSWFIMPNVSLPSVWLYNVPTNEINVAFLERMRDDTFRTQISYSEIQKELLGVVSAKFRVDLKQVAANLQVTATDLWTTYDANDWEAVVHSIVKESVDAHVQLLELASNESLAQLVRMTVIDLYNASLAEFENKTFSLYPMKMLLQNKTSELISPFNLSVQPESITVASLASMITSFTPQDLGLLYQLNLKQVRTIDRSSFADISYMCKGYNVSVLLDKTPFSILSIIAGTKRNMSRCPILVNVKGNSISTLNQSTPVSVLEMSLLEILTVSTGLTWRKVFRVVSTAMSEWEILDSVTVPKLASLSSTNESAILHDSISHAVEIIYSLKRNGSLNSTIDGYRVKLRNYLETLLNISTSAVATYTNTSEGTLQKSTSSQLFAKFIQATVVHFEIKVEDINNTLKLSPEELYNLPKHEWAQIVPPIIDAVMKFEAEKLKMRVEDLYTFLGISANSSTVEQMNVLIATKIKSLITSLNKFVNITIQTWLTDSSTQDTVYGEMTVLEAILNATGFSKEGLIFAYDLNEGQINVLKTMEITNLMTYCKMNTSLTKSLTPYNLTALTVGIQTMKPSCVALAFYVSSEVQTIGVSKGEISVLTNRTASLVELVEKATGLPWRMSVSWLGVHLSAWTVLDGLTLLNIPSKNLTQVESITFQQLISYSLHQNSSGNLDSILEQFRQRTKTKMFNMFNTNEDEISALLNVTRNQITTASLTVIFKFVLDSFHKKFGVSLLDVANSTGVMVNDLSYLAPTEWYEVLPSLRDQIVQSGQSKLNVDLTTLSLLLQETNLGTKTLRELEFLWDKYVTRFLKSKSDAQIKSITTILQEHGYPPSNTVMNFVKDNINVSAVEYSLLFGLDLKALSVLENYTLTEIPSACRRTQNQMLSKSSLNLTKAMIGYDDIITCKNIALVTALRSLPIDTLASNFSIAINDTSSMLDVWRNEITVSWMKLLWGFNLSLAEWPFIAAFSLESYLSLDGLSVADIKSNTSYAQIATSIRARNVDSNLNLYRQTLLNKTFEMFAVSSTEICGGVIDPCTTKVIDIFNKTITTLRSKLKFDLVSLAGNLGITPYELQVLIPFHWQETVPYIVSESYQNVASMLNLTQDRLSILLDSSTNLILNMSLDEFIPIVTNKVDPLVTTKIEMESMTLKQLAKTRGVDVDLLQNKSGIEIIHDLFNTSLSNISFLFDWNTEFVAALHNYTVFESSRKINNKDLLDDRSVAKLLLLMATVVPYYKPPPRTCKSGFVLNKETSKCIDEDECNGGANPCDAKTQTCQNYMGGHGCDCIKPGTFYTLGKCQRGVILLLSCRYKRKTFSSDLLNKASEEFYQQKVETENSVNKVFIKSQKVGHFYHSCKLRNFMKGSVIFEIYLYFNSDFNMELSDLKKIFVSNLNNTAGQDSYYLGADLVDHRTITVTDFDECSSHQDDCHEHAECVNMFGSFSCKCKSGFDDLSGDGRECKASFLKTMWWIIIIIAFLIVVLIITIIVLILRKPKSNSRYGMREFTKTTSEISLVNKNGAPSGRKLSRTSEISYRDGDVYYRDKDGKQIRGESGRHEEIGKDNLVLKTFQPDPNMRASGSNGQLENGHMNKNHVFRLGNGTLTKDQIEDEKTGNSDVAYWTIRERETIVSPPV